MNMQTTKAKSRFIVFFVLCMLFSFCFPFITASADDMDGVGQAQQAQQQQGSGNAIGDYMQGYNPVDKDDMAKANSVASPVVNLIGQAIGIITVVTSAGIFLVTALDLAYIGLPFIRPLLTSRWQLVSDEAIAVVPGGAKPGGQQGGAQPGGMGGMSGGMGGMSGGMGMGGMSGGMGMGGMSGGMGGQQKQNTKSCILK